MVWNVRDQQLQVRSDFPHKVNVIEHVWGQAISMPVCLLKNKTSK